MHFAHWGRQGAQFRPFIEDAVREVQPDYIIFALGFNDLAWRYWPTDLVGIMQELVTKARAAKPDAKFAVGNVVQRMAYASKPMLPELTRMYNTLLEEAILRWRTEESPVELVRMRESYECGLGLVPWSRRVLHADMTCTGDPWGCPASHDGLHPNARGEYQIARAFARTLHEKYGLGSPNFTVPTYIPPRPCAPPTALKAIVVPDAGNNGTTTKTATIHLSWDRFYGAFGYYWQHQFPGGNWGVLPGLTETSSVNKTGVGLGERWEMRVSTYCGDQQPHSNWSHVLSVST
jgi:lysophospholipase L1-like esterase